MKKTLNIAIMASFVVCLLMMPMQLKAGEDVKLWSSISHTSYLTENIFIDFEEELRFNEDVSNLYQVHFNVSAGWKFNSMFKLSAGYRARASDWDYIQNEYLVNGYCEYKIGKDFEIDYRLRYHHKDVYEDHKENKEYIRNKIAFSYEVSKRVKPFVSFEALYRFNYDKASRFDEMRYFIGCSFDLPSKVELDLYYGFQDEMNVKRPDDGHIIGIALSLGKNKYKDKNSEVVE